MTGRRAEYVAPFRYFVTLLAIALLINAWVGFDPASSGPIQLRAAAGAAA